MDYKTCVFIFNSILETNIETRTGFRCQTYLKFNLSNILFILFQPEILLLFSLLINYHCRNQFINTLLVCLYLLTNIPLLFMSPHDSIQQKI